MGVVDALTGTFRLPCPVRGTAQVRLSSFRLIDRLPGVAHPALYQVVFACGCGDEHVALVAHDDLDRAPLGLDADGAFLNLMTDRTDDLSGELVSLASERIRRGEWPWSFFCVLEQRPQPVTPSFFQLIAPERVAVFLAVRCPSCGSASINLVSHAHLDVPFHTDRTIAVVRHAFEADELRTIDAFRAELGSATFDEKRLALP